ncbi:glycosyltransferase [Corynebacterium hesseae]
MNSVVLYGDVNANIVDGSSTWLVSLARVLSHIVDRVHLVLKCQVENDTLLQSLVGINNVSIYEPEDCTASKGMAPEKAAAFLQKIVEEQSATIVIARGLSICYEISRIDGLAPLLWAYVTDIPYPTDKLSVSNISQLEQIARSSCRIFAQTEAARSYWEAVVPLSAGKTVLMPPMIPDEAFSSPDEKDAYNGRRPLRIVYAGKLASGWRTLEMLELPRELGKLGVPATLEVIVAKIDGGSAAPEWEHTMRRALEEADSDPSSGVKWYGVLPRDEVIKRIGNSDIGYSCRTENLDSSLEVSTKALEYGAASAAPLINRTQDHCEIWGEGYPFFVDAVDTISTIAQRIVSALPELSKAQTAAWRASEHFSMRAAISRLERAFSRAIDTPVSDPDLVEGPVRIVVASHDLKFMGELMEHLMRSDRYEVRQDPWKTLHEHDELLSEELVEWADVVFCEWAGPALEWYSKNCQPSTQLVSRLHRFELEGPWMDQVLWESVDSMIFVSEWVRRTAVAKFGMQGVETAVIPNSIDLDDFDRPKVRNAEFTIGMVGYVPFLKRPDRALDLIESVISEDPRYTLRFKGRFPWEYPHVWNDPLQKQLYLEFFNRIASSRALKEHVAFDGFTADIASWYRGIGYILSPSELESFHLAPAEAMASRCVPLLWDREGVEDIFGPFASETGTAKAVETILESGERGAFPSMGSRAREYSSKWDKEVVMSQWDEVLCKRIGSNGA